MAYDLSSIRSSKIPTAITMTLTGPSKIGKTTTCAALRNSIGILTEDGARHVNANTFPLCLSLADVYECISTLITQKHSYETVWLDSLDWLEPLLYAHVCKANNWVNLEAAGYGKGYIFAANEFKEGFLSGINTLRARGINVILIAHDKIKRIESPLSDAFDAYQLKLNDRLAALVTEFCDVLAYASYKPILKHVDTGFNKKEAKAVSMSERILHLSAHPAMPSGNRLNWQDIPLQANALQGLFDSVRIGDKEAAKEAPEPKTAKA